jgi:hypothetical protein
MLKPEEPYLLMAVYPQFQQRRQQRRLHQQRNVNAELWTRRHAADAPMLDAP